MKSERFLIKLKEIKVNENGMFEAGKEAANFIEALLIHPRADVASIRTILELNLTDNQDFFKEKEKEIAAIEFPDNLSDKDKKNLKLQFELELYKTQLLFNQYIEGEAYLDINVSAIEKVNKVEKLLVGLLGTGIKTGLGLVPGLGSVVKGAVSPAVDTLFEGSTTDKKRLKSIGKGILKIDKNTKIGETTVSLYAPKDITIRPIHKWEPTPGGGARLRPEVTDSPKKLAKWQPNGYIKLQITKF